jgi:diguanylate cyclase (GGDEF)-like protein/PAS domain S-box-containing protein
MHMTVSLYVLTIALAVGAFWGAIWHRRGRATESSPAIPGEAISGSRTYFFLTVSALVALIGAFALYVWAEKEIDRANEIRYISFQLADELRQSSDDLTRMARTYVVTADPIYELRYHEILDVRNGKLPRPENYNGIYWGLVLSDEVRRHPANHGKTALLDLMKQAGFTDAEFAKLADAKAKSDALTKTDLAAMELVKLAGPDAEGNRAIARAMVFGQEYSLARAAIMKPIDDFRSIAQKGTEQAVKFAEQRATASRILVAALGAFMVFMLWRSYTQLGKTLGGRVDDVYDHLERIGKGDFSTPILLAPEQKSSVLGLIAETQKNLSVLEDRNRALLERTVQIVDASMDAIITMDRHDTITGWNPQAAIIFGWSASEAVGRNLSETIIPPAQRAAHKRGLQHYLESGCGAVLIGKRTEVVGLRRDGSEFPVELAIEPVTINGERQFCAFLRDISERKRAEEELQLASLVYNTSSEAMMVTDTAGRIVAVNAAFTQMTGYRLDEVVGQTPNILHSDRHDQAFYQAMWQEINATGKWQGEVWDRHKNGEIYPKWLSINTTSGKDGAAERRVALFYDITEKKKSEDVMWRQANFDSLTGLPNRQMFTDRLDQGIKKSHRADLPLALMFLDLDRFKEINDTLGHPIGDMLLKETAGRLASCVRDTDTVARLGGDEFTVILGEQDDIGNVERVAQDILRKLAKPFHLASEVVYLTTSIGITFYPQDAEGIDTLIKNADQAMYAAKSQGRNRYNYFTPAMQEAAQTRMRLANDLRGALAGNQFRVYYQPIVELATGEIRKAEALIRWQHPTRGLVNPIEFIHIAEDIGTIVDIGDWVLREAAREVARCRESHHKEFQISVNESPIQFQSDSTCHIAWPEYLRQLGLPGESIIVEITESSLMEASATVVNHLLGFREAGIQVSLDDFGTGYSSLSYLKRFEIDYLKIDQSFVRNLTADSQDMALSEAIIVMAHKLGLKVIAEGVETAEQRDLLAAVGCDYVQGYLYSEPLPAEAFAAFLVRQNESVARQFGRNSSGRLGESSEYRA